jgi:hypothetical protein
VPPPEPPDRDASQAEILAFDKKNLWVGQVLEVRAASTSRVFLRMFWYYWPDELPRGRQQYHGKRELIMSNHMEIVDAMTVASGADISHWDEKVEDQDVGERFWRQFYDVRLRDSKSGGLSAIREHCVCREYYNPDETMLRCPNAKCGLWNHQECLEHGILAQTYARLMGPESSMEAKPKLFPASKLAQLNEQLRSTVGLGRKTKATAAKSASVKNYAKQPALWEGRLKAEITVGEKSGKALVTVTDQRAQEPEVWTESIQCLNCGTLIE